MKRFGWEISLGAALIAASAGLYYAEIRIFHAERDTLFYLFQDLAFVPAQVLLVTLILNQLLNIREKKAMLNKLNMVIGPFFSEVGTGLLKLFLLFDHQPDTIMSRLLVSAEWPDQRFSLVAKNLKSCDCEIVCKQGDLEALKSFIVKKRDCLLRLQENPNLLEHETFTELLWAVFHLTEELAARDDLSRLSAPDCAHIGGDIRRAYLLLIAEWLAYMMHLKREYPYRDALVALRQVAYRAHRSANRRRLGSCRRIARCHRRGDCDRRGRRRTWVARQRHRVESRFHSTRR